MASTPGARSVADHQAVGRVDPRCNALGPACAGIARPQSTHDQQSRRYVPLRSVRRTTRWRMSMTFIDPTHGTLPSFDGTVSDFSMTGRAFGGWQRSALGPRVTGS